MSDTNPPESPPSAVVRKSNRLLLVSVAVISFAAVGTIILITRDEWLGALQGKQKLEPPDPYAESSRENYERIRAKRTSVFDRNRSNLPKELHDKIRPAVDANVIPALSDPKFVAADKAHFLKPDHRVMGVVIENVPRAYPVSILNWHEAVNDRIGETLFAVTYCPLCDSFGAFNRKTADGVVDLGVSGRLFNSNVLFYDRRKAENLRESPLWSQMQLTTRAGQTGERALSWMPSEVTTWADWKARYPQTTVLDTNTGYRRPYDRSPYETYFQETYLQFPVEHRDERLPLKTRIIGLWAGEHAVAVPLTESRTDGSPQKITIQLGDKSATIEFNSKKQTARVIKADDGVKWMHCLWFAWAAFHQKTEIRNPGESPGS